MAIFAGPVSAAAEPYILYHKMAALIPMYHSIRHQISTSTCKWLGNFQVAPAGESLYQLKDTNDL